MKPFKFPMDSYIKIKEMDKKEVEDKINSLFLESLSIQEEINNLEAKIKEVSNMRKSLVSSLFKPKTAEMYNEYLYFINNELKIFKRKLLDVEEKIDILRQELYKIINELKGLHELREKRYKEYLTECEKEQEKEMEDRINFSFMMRTDF